MENMPIIDIEKWNKDLLKKSIDEYRSKLPANFLNPEFVIKMIEEMQKRENLIYGDSHPFPELKFRREIVIKGINERIDTDGAEYAAAWGCQKILCDEKMYLEYIKRPTPEDLINYIRNSSIENLEDDLLTIKEIRDFSKIYGSPENPNIERLITTLKNTITKKKIESSKKPDKSIIIQNIIEELSFKSYSPDKTFIPVNLKDDFKELLINPVLCKKIINWTNTDWILWVIIENFVDLKLLDIPKPEISNFIITKFTIKNKNVIKNDIDSNVDRAEKSYKYKTLKNSLNNITANYK